MDFRVGMKGSASLKLVQLVMSLKFYIKAASAVVKRTWVWRVLV